MTTPIFRTAEAADIPAIVDLLADDMLGQGRETTDDLTPYATAFQAMAEQGGNQIILAVDTADQVLGCLQLTLIPGLSRGGQLRAQIEGVRVAGAARGQGLGEQLIRHAIDRARDQGATLIQLTSDLQRSAAIRFYERLGFQHSHAGMKRHL